MQIQYWGYLTAKYYSITRSALIMSFSGCLNALAHPSPYSFFFMKTSHLEKLESFELFLHNGNSATLGSLGFPSIKSHEHEWLQVALEPISGFCSYWWSKDRNAFSPPPMMAVEKVRIMSSSFLGLSPDDGPPVGQLDFEGNVDDVGQHKRTFEKT